MPLLSPPPGGGARTALACLTPPRPARPLLTRQAWLGLRAPPPPGAGLKAGRGRGEKWASSLASPEGAETTGPPRLGLLLLSLTLPSRPSLPAEGPRQEEVARTEPGDNCQLEALLGGEEEGPGEKGEGTQRPQPPSPRLSGLGRGCGKKQRKRHRRRRR